MVLLRAEGQEARKRRTAEPDHRERVLESDRFGPENSDSVWSETHHRVKEDPGFLHGKSSQRTQNRLGDEWVPFTRQLQTTQGTSFLFIPLIHHGKVLILTWPIWIFLNWVQEIVLCKIYRKATSLKVLEERAEREMKQMVGSPASPPSSTDTMSFGSPQEEANVSLPLPLLQHVLKKESESEEIMGCVVPKQEKTSTQLGLKDTNNNSKGSSCGTSSLQMPFGKDNLPDLQLPMLTDWTQDTFWAQLNSPWLQNLTPSNILNFYWLHTESINCNCNFKSITYYYYYLFWNVYAVS